MATLISEHEKLVYKRPEALEDIHTHYCPGCTHGTAHRLVAEVIDELGPGAYYLGCLSRLLGFLLQLL